MTRKTVLDALARMGVDPDHIAPCRGAFCAYVDLGAHGISAGLVSQIISELAGVAITPGVDFEFDEAVGNGASGWHGTWMWRKAEIGRWATGRPAGVGPSSFVTNRRNYPAPPTSPFRKVGINRLLNPWEFTVDSSGGMRGAKPGKLPAVSLSRLVQRERPSGRADGRKQPPTG